MQSRRSKTKANVDHAGHSQLLEMYCSSLGKVDAFIIVFVCARRLKAFIVPVMASLSP